MDFVWEYNYAYLMIDITVGWGSGGLEKNHVRRSALKMCHVASRLLEVEWLNELWRPDSFFKNAKQVTFQTMTIPNHYVWLYKNRKILYMVK